MNTNSPTNSPGLSTPISNQIHRDPPRTTVDCEELAQEILLDYQLETAIPMLVLARRHNVTMYALLDFLDDPETQRRIEQIRRLCEQREKLIGYDARCAATQRLESIALREKDVETARKAATTLLRPVAASRPPKSNPVDARTGRSEDPAVSAPLPPSLVQPPPAAPPIRSGAEVGHAAPPSVPRPPVDRAA